MTVLGPFIVSIQHSGFRNPDGFEYTGKCVQVAINGEVTELPVFIDSDRYFKDRIELYDFFVCEEALDWSIFCQNFHVKRSFDGTVLVRLEPVLVNLMIRIEQDPVIFFDWMRDLSKGLGVNYGSMSFPANEQKLLDSRAEELGVLIEPPMPAGRTIYFNIGIDLRLAHHPEPRVEHCCCLSFRPRPDGTIGKIAWDWESIENAPRFGNTLIEALRKLGVDGENLLTPKGEEFLLSHFEWTKLARMTTRQAREARLHLLLQHEDSWEDFSFLLNRLRQEELYSPNTSDNQILKSLPNLISSAKSLSQ